MPTMTPTLALTDPRTTAFAIAAGYPLERVEEDPDRDRLIFHVANAPADFHLAIAQDRITVSARAALAALETVMSLVAHYKQRRRAGR